jgi:nucleotide-binding universal stress UspA family protein
MFGTKVLSFVDQPPLQFGPWSEIVDVSIEKGTVMTNNEIVVGFDVSPPSLAALAWAASQARSTGCTVRALHVVDWARTRNLYTVPVVEDRVYDEDDPVDVEYRRQIEEAFASVGPADDWTLQFGQGHAGRVLVDRSRDARLLVVGSREHVGLERVLVGSASHYCVSHAKCPVVVVPVVSPKRVSGRHRSKLTRRAGRSAAST